MRGIAFEGGMPKSLRMSTILRLLRQWGHDVFASKLEALAVAHGACDRHGKLEDPVVCLAGGDTGQSLIIACPWCSDEPVRLAWIAEGEREPA